MKAKRLTATLLAGLMCIGASAHAVHLNPNGLGEVLLYPYYTIENGQDTYFSVVNTTDTVKAVRVRLRESMNAADALSFNLYLAPHDHWSGAITRDPSGAGALLKTWDTSCTVPHISSAGIKLSNTSYITDGGPIGLERTREGFIEMIEMGVLDDQAPDVFGAEAAAIHSTSGIPADCSLLRDAWEEIPVGSGNIVGEWSDPTTNLIFDVNLAGGLYGYGIIINVAEGTNATYDAVALESFAGEILHSHPNSAQPNLGSALPNAKILERNKFITLEFDSAQSGLDAVSAVLMQNTLENDFVLEPSMAAGTDWVVTFPTKRDYVNPSTPIAPFLSTWAAPGVACDNVGITTRDREEQQRGDYYIPPPGIDFPISPVPLPPVEWANIDLCGSANVISFLGPLVDPDDENIEGYVSALYPSNRAQVLYPVVWPNGLVRLSMAQDNSGNDRILSADDDTELYGLPVIGFAVQKYANTNLSGVNGSGAFYAGVISHKTERRIELQP